MIKKKTEELGDSKTHLRRFARGMRRLPTEAERNFWTMVRDRRFNGLKFRRQVPIGNYIADFVCPDHKLIVEIDGEPHEANRRYDVQRDAFLVSQGFQVLRFWNHEISADIYSVLQIIKHAIDTSPSSPSPLRGEGRGEGASTRDRCRKRRTDLNTPPFPVKFRAISTPPHPGPLPPRGGGGYRIAP